MQSKKRGFAHLERYVGRGLGQVVALERVPSVGVFSEEHLALQRNCGQWKRFSGKVKEGEPATVPIGQRNAQVRTVGIMAVKSRKSWLKKSRPALL